MCLKSEMPQLALDDVKNCLVRSEVNGGSQPVRSEVNGVAADESGDRFHEAHAPY